MRWSLKRISKFGVRKQVAASLAARSTFLFPSMYFSVAPYPRERYRSGAREQNWSNFWLILFNEKTKILNRSKTQIWIHYKNALKWKNKIYFLYYEIRSAHLQMLLLLFKNQLYRIHFQNSPLTKTWIKKKKNFCYICI